MSKALGRAQELRKLQKEILASKACPRLIKYCKKVAREKRAMYRDQEYWGKALPSFGDPEAQLMVEIAPEGCLRVTGLESSSFERFTKPVSPLNRRHSTGMTG